MLPKVRTRMIGGKDRLCRLTLFTGIWPLHSHPYDPSSRASLHKVRWISIRGGSQVQIPFEGKDIIRIQNITCYACWGSVIPLFFLDPMVPTRLATVYMLAAGCPTHHHKVTPDTVSPKLELRRCILTDD